MKTYTVMDLNLFGGTDAMPDGKETVKIRRARGGDEAALAGLIAGYMPGDLPICKGGRLSGVWTLRMRCRRGISACFMR